MQHVPAAGLTCKMIDVSHWQPRVDFSQVKASGVDAAMIKVSEGIGGVDPLSRAHWGMARAAAFTRMGGYHFFHPSQDPVVQAVHFVGSIPELRARDFVALDLEVTDNVPAAIDYTRVIAFMDKVQALTGRTPLLYSGPYFMQAIGGQAALAKYPLWNAHYGPPPAQGPLVPPPWKTWTFWQYTSKAVVPGVAGLCDMSYFNGSLQQLIAL